MLVPLSKLDKHIIRGVVMAVETARATLAGVHNLSTEEPEITFTLDVYDDTLEAVEGDITETLTPDSVTTSEKGEETSTQTQEAQTTVEQQVTTPGTETSSQAFGRGTTTTFEETT